MKSTYKDKYLNGFRLVCGFKAIWLVEHFKAANQFA